MAAFTVDVGYVGAVREECQNVADSAALAGAARLDAYISFQGAVDTTLRTTLQQKAISKARTTATKYVQANTAGSVRLNIDANMDIQVGYWDSAAKTFTPTSVPDNNWPNAVQVKVRRDDTNPGTTSNGAVGLFFGSALGLSKVNVTATAIASISPTSPTVTVLGNQNSTGGPGGFLPFAVDVESWEYYLHHGSIGPGLAAVDAYSTPKGLGVQNAVYGADGIPEFQVWPLTAQIHPSQKGLLSFATTFGGNGNTISDWINPGPSGSDLAATFPPDGFAPPMFLYGTPGNKLGHFSDVTGQIRTLPLVDYTKSTDGNQGQYYTVAVALVQVVYGPDGTGIFVQPYSGSIPSAVSGTPPNSSYTYTDDGGNQAVPPFSSTLYPPGFNRYTLVK
jgi:hypothetical protein